MSGSTTARPTGPSHPQPGASGGSSSVVRLRVRGSDGRPRPLEVTASNEAEAIRQAAARGFAVLAIDSAAPTVAASAGPAARFPLLLFSQELLALLDAGLNLGEALATLLAKERHAPARAVLQDIVQAVAEGHNFSAVLARHPQHFPEVYVATVRAAERSGDLSPALARFVTYQLQFDAIRKKLVSAAIYPLMLLAVGAFIALFLLGYVVPRFAVVYDSAGRDVPQLTLWLLSLGKMIHQHWQAAALAVTATMAMTVGTLARPEGRRWLVERLLRLPWLAARSEAFRLARCYRAVSLLLASGIALPRALAMVAGLLVPSQQASLERARTRIEQGLSLSVALVAEGLASPVAESLLKVGERSGQLAEMLERAARFHDEELARWIDWASRLLEPILMAAMGVVIGAIVVLMYMPIFDLAGSLQ